MNNAMVTHYLGLEPLSPKYQDYLVRVNSDKVVQLLGDMGISWSYEIQNEGYTTNGINYHVTVILYLPGFVRTGTAATSNPLAEDVIRQTVQRAIHNACSTLSRAKGQPATVDQQKRVNSDTNIVDKQQTAHNGMSAPQGQPQEQQQQGPGQTPRSQAGRWSPEKVEAMNKFKERFEIVNDEQLVRYLSLWRPEITSKRQLNPENVEEFIKWADGMAQSLF